MMTEPALSRDEILADPGFGRHLTDHMVTARYAGGSWSEPVLVHEQPLWRIGP